jgi:hypothetical protein
LLRPREEVDRSVMGELADMETGLRLCSQHAGNIRRSALESESRGRGLFAGQQLRQLGDIDRNPPRYVSREPLQMGGAPR